MRNILFFYPSHRIGGAELLASRLAIWLSKNSNYTIYVCDYSDGFLIDSCKESSVKHVVFNNFNEAVCVPESTVVVAYTQYMFKIKRLFKFDNTCRFLFWSVRPESIVFQFLMFNHRLSLVSRKTKLAIGSLIKELVAANSLYFMDYPNYKAPSSFFNFNIDDVKYLQILIPSSVFLQKCEQESKVEDERLNFLWLGRLDSDKLNSLLLLIRELDILNAERKLSLSIVGNGNCESVIRTEGEKCNYEINYMGVLKGDELYNYVRDYADICVAQGTSALELAACNKPVILVDIYNKLYQPHEVKFNLLNQMTGYSVGEVYDNTTKREYYFCELISFIMSNYEQCCIDNRKYVEDNFSINVVAPKFLESVEIIARDDSGAQEKIISKLIELFDSTPVGLLSTIKYKIRIR